MRTAEITTPAAVRVILFATDFSDAAKGRSRTQPDWRPGSVPSWLSHMRMSLPTTAFAPRTGAPQTNRPPQECGSYRKR